MNLINKCRVCGGLFFTKPLLVYKNMPKSAQFLPTKKELKNEKGIDIRLEQCSYCGLIQLANKEVSYYKVVIRTGELSSEMSKFRKNQFNDFVNKFDLKNKKIMEIGCGKGEYLKLMENAGAEVYGIEDSIQSVLECQKKNLKVQKGFVDSENYKFFKTPVKAFFILNFLEHLPDINSVLRGIRNNLENGGLGLIEVPFFDLKRKVIFTELVSDHLLYFTEDTLRFVLEFNGFEVLEIYIVWHGFIISAVVRKRIVIDLINFNKNKDKLGNEIKDFFKIYKKGEVAIWGASHQALEILSLYNLNKKIKYIIDSAIFKQGKFTPSSHVPIVSPEYFESNPVKAILILAAGFSEEVSKIIKNKYGNKINLAIIENSGLHLLK